MNDPAFPILPQALDRDSFREILRGALTPRDGHRFRFEDCRLRRFRVRPGERCLIEYDLVFRDPTTNERQTHIASGCIYADGRVVRTFARQRAALLNQPPGDLPVEPLCLIPRLGMLLQLYPYDHRLPTLRRLAAGFPERWWSAAATAFGPGCWRIQDSAVECVRYRAFLGATLRYRVSARDSLSARTEHRNFYAKVYRDGRGDRSWAQLLALRAATSVVPASAQVVRPLVFSKELRAILLDEAPGESLIERIEKGDVAAFGRIGEAMAAFAAVSITPSRTRPRTEFLDRVYRARRVLVEGGMQAPVIDAVVRQIMSDLLDVPPQPTHLDIKPDHIFVRGSTIRYIDLDSFAGADPVYDLAALLARLAHRSAQPGAPVESFLAAGQKLTSGYSRAAPIGWRRRLPALFACAALQQALELAQEREALWEERALRIIVRAACALRDGPIWPEGE